LVERARNFEAEEIRVAKLLGLEPVSNTLGLKESLHIERVSGYYESRPLLFFLNFRNNRFQVAKGREWALLPVEAALRRKAQHGYSVVDDSERRVFRKKAKDMTPTPDVRLDLKTRKDCKRRPAEFTRNPGVLLAKPSDKRLVGGRSEIVISNPDHLEPHFVAPPQVLLGYLTAAILRRVPTQLRGRIPPVRFHRRLHL
jgi:hypothetical protein